MKGNCLLCFLDSSDDQQILVVLLGGMYSSRKLISLILEHDRYMIDKFPDVIPIPI